MLCPMCKNPTLVRTMVGWMGTEHFKCENCDYEGGFYLEVDFEETGDKFADMEKLKAMFPDDVDPETDIKLEKDFLREELQDHLNEEDPKQAD